MDPLNMLTYNGPDAAFIPEAKLADQYATPAHQRQQREPLLGSHWRPTEQFHAHPPQSEALTLTGACSPSNASEISDSPGLSPERVKRPRNAFMIFRSEFNSMGDKINRSVEHDNRHISRIVGHYWNQLSDQEKDVWRKKADNEKLDHMRKHPGYKFTPSPRSSKKLKRNVKRNGDDEMERCRLVADLLLEGKQGDDLLNALQATDPRDHKVGSSAASGSSIPSRQKIRMDQYSDFASVNRIPDSNRPPQLIQQFEDPKISSEYMNMGANVDHGPYHTQQFQYSSQRMHPYVCIPTNPPTMHAIRDDASRMMNDYAHFSEAPVDMYSPTDVQSTYPPQYPLSPPSDIEDYHQGSHVHGEVSNLRASRRFPVVDDAGQWPRSSAHHPPPHGEERKIQVPIVSRDPLYSHNPDYGMHTHSTPSTSPTDTRGHRGDPAMLRRQQHRQ